MLYVTYMLVHSFIYRYSIPNTYYTHTHKLIRVTNPTARARRIARTHTNTAGQRVYTIYILLCIYVCIIFYTLLLGRQRPMHVYFIVVVIIAVFRCAVLTFVSCIFVWMYACLQYSTHFVYSYVSIDFFIKELMYMLLVW